MAADDIQTISSATSGASDTLTSQGTGLPVSSDTLERWARAVTAPAVSHERDADTPVPSAQADPGQPTQAERQPGFGRLNAVPERQTFTSAAAERGLSAPPQSGFGDALSSPEVPVNTQAPANASRGDTRTAGASPGQAPAATPSRTPANPQTGFSAQVPFGAALAISTSATPASSALPLTQTVDRSAEVSFSARGAPAQVHEQGVQLNREAPHRSEEADGKATTAWSSQAALAQNEVAGSRALSLSALRGLHANHRQNRLDASLLDTTQPETSAPQQINAAINANLLMPRAQVQPSLDAGVAADSVTAVGGHEQLHALIESCCSRLWVNEGGSRAAQGVMLDLGRWMPGCTVEVAKAAGVLRITLRGVDGSERARLEDELQSLGDGLADKLGCKVVAAVATNKELT